MMAVLVQHRARHEAALPRRNDDQRARPAARVARGRLGAAEDLDVLGPDDPDRDVADLVAVRGRAEQDAYQSTFAFGSRTSKVIVRPWLS